MDENGAQVSDAVALRQFVENLVCQWVARGGEVTKNANPLRADEKLVGLLGGVVLQQECCKPFHLGQDLAVGAAQQFVHTGFGGTGQTA